MQSMNLSVIPQKEVSKLLNVDRSLLLIFISIISGLSIIYTIFQYLLKFESNKKISKIIFSIFTFTKTFIIILIFALIIYFIYNIYNTINQYLSVIELRKYVKNLSRERVLAKISILDFTSKRFNCLIELYSLSGKVFKKLTYELIGTEFYIDFVVLNFDYLFIEKGANNIAYPSILFSDEISYDNGYKLLDMQEIKNYLNADVENFLGLSAKKVDSISNFIFKCIENENYAKINGVRSVVGSALHRKIISLSTYKVYLENTGGLILVEENF